VPIPNCRFSVYGRYVLEVERVDDHWKIIKQVGERRVILHDFAIPSWMTDCDEIAIFLDDMLHESSGAGDAIRRV